MSLRCAIIKIISYLALGVISSILVAWAFAYWQYADNQTPFNDSQQSILLHRYFPNADFEKANLHVPPTIYYAVGVNRVAERALTYTTTNATSYLVTIESAGFPCLCIQGERATQSSWYPPTAELDLNVRSWALRSRNGIAGADATLLPYGPLFPGLIINTLFYALLCWLLVSSPGAVKRYIRRRRKLCVRCGYPVGSSPTCTECGAPLPSKLT